MKPNSEKKRLSIRPETIRKLADAELQEAHGGTILTATIVSIVSVVSVVTIATKG